MLSTFLSVFLLSFGVTFGVLLAFAAFFLIIAAFSPNFRSAFLKSYNKQK